MLGRGRVTCDIFIRSYYRDFDWLAYCLASIQKYCSGFRHTVLVVPAKSLPRLLYRGLGGDCTFVCKSYADDYLGQQVSKLTADQYSDAEYICHVDSDCLFHRPTTPSDLCIDGKPRIVMKPYDRMPPTSSWRNITTKCLGHDVSFDFMQQLPLLFPRAVYAGLRSHVEAVHDTDIESYVIAQPYRGFSEFNALGAFAYHYRREAFTWVDSSREPVPRAPCHCFWSWAGIDAPTRASILRALGPDVEPAGTQRAD